MKQLILIRGIPGSGKSTLANHLKYSILDAQIFEADQYFVNAQGEYNFDAKMLYRAHQECRENTFKHIDEGKTAIVANTFVKPFELKPYFDMAYERGIKPVVYVAQNEFGSIHNVPQEKIEQMKRNFVHDIQFLFKT